MEADTVEPSARRVSLGRPVFKHGRKAMPRQFKNKTVDYKHRSSLTERESTRKKVYMWIRAKDRIERIAKCATTGKYMTVRARGTGTTLPFDVEEQLARWVLGMRKDGIPVTYAMLRMMALEAAIDVGLSEDEFKAGWHWIKAMPRQFKNKTVDYKHRSSLTERESTRKKVYMWIRAKDRIERIAKCATTGKYMTVRARGTGTTLPFDVEEQLARWVLGMRKDGIPVTYAMLRMMALEAAIDVGLSEDEFKAGWHWIKGFKKRHDLTFRTKTSS
ncbi:hypothetical protein H310_06258 [Aphanomyces invadans]|uniref:HTH CENPB-type domain-containing protein n=1 Tax=Aphanomyces invadans TaxID=157072 RepID=A0A024U5C8_9STRA|nr:hypothetical protein H310_06258 [Aphanomyces invadans]ETW01626.1 hypothetical protein H310_06258 [Aphanomyces invadans]|eukprot:XP_008869474.1 hypothetical protein H310_06258 [Aphanomyces invadans]